MKFTLGLFFLFVWTGVYEVSGQVRLPRLISDGAVFQREVELKTWGWASPSEEVELTFQGKTFKGRADSLGVWKIILPPQPAGGPYELVFKGKNLVRLSNILFGDVWICSGQSNMELTMDRVKDKYYSVISSSNNSHIRHFEVPDGYDFNKQHIDLVGGSWSEASPANVLKFSAVGYFFAMELYKKYNVPIGIINAALGGSPIEAWMSEDAIREFPNAYQEYSKFKSDSLIQAIESQDRERAKSWYAALNASDLGLQPETKFREGNFGSDKWSTMEVPGYWDKDEQSNIDGSVWLKKEINVSANMIGKPARLWLGRIVDMDSVFINNTFVGTTGYQYPPRKYTVGSSVLKEGKNTILIRIINNSGPGGLVPDKPYFLATETDTVQLAGTWQYKIGSKMKPLPGQTFIRWKPVGLFNKMLSPLLQTQIKGALWYQGESNTGRPAEYKKLLPALVKDWRSKWHQGEFPFIFVQLPNFMEVRKEPGESQWAEFRNMQLQSLDIPNTAMVITIDVGEWNDIHPLNKADIGKRLALQARRIAYGEKELVSSGPVPLRATFKKNTVIIEFENVGKGLQVKDGKSLNHFAISEDGKVFKWASAKIKGNSVIVSSSGGDIKTVRYAWADNPASANLYNKEGLPASPFEIKQNE